MAANALLDPRLHLLEEIIRKTHPADIDRKTEIVVAQKIFLETAARESLCPWCKGSQGPWTCRLEINGGTGPVPSEFLTGTPRFT